MIKPAPRPSSTLQGMVLPVGQTNLLLPNTAVAEILTFRRPDPVKSAAAWFSGIIDWRDHLVPVVSFAEPPEEGAEPDYACVVICYIPSGNPELPYLGVLATEVPRLVTFKAADLQSAAASPRRPGPFVQHALRYANQPAWIPDLDALEHALLAAQ